jgi:hypothetical protein
MPATAPYVDLPLVNGQIVQASANSVAYVRQDPADVGRSFFGTYSQETSEPWHVALSADAVTAALVAASGGGGGGGGGNQPGGIIAAVGIAGNGTVLGGYFAPGVGLVGVPYTPGSGIYDFAVTGTPPGTFYNVQVTGTQAPALQALWQADQPGPSQIRVAGASVPAGAWGDWAFYLLIVRMN